MHKHTPSTRKRYQQAAAEWYQTAIPNCIGDINCYSPVHDDVDERIDHRAEIAVAAYKYTMHVRITGNSGRRAIGACFVPGATLQTTHHDQISST